MTPSCPSILVKDRDTQQYVAVFGCSQELFQFLNNQKSSGFDIARKYEVYSFQVQGISYGDEALAIIQDCGFLDSEKMD